MLRLGAHTASFYAVTTDITQCEVQVVTSDIPAQHANSTWWHQHLLVDVCSPDTTDATSPSKVSITIIQSYNPTSHPSATCQTTTITSNKHQPLRLKMAAEQLLQYSQQWRQAIHVISRHTTLQGCLWCLTGNRHMHLESKNRCMLAQQHKTGVGKYEAADLILALCKAGRLLFTPFAGAQCKLMRLAGL